MAARSRLILPDACPGRAAGAKSRMLSYSSDGLGLYARLALPATPPPEGGYPVVLFLHGWVGADAAPDYPFSCNEGGYYAHVINAWSDAGYAVLSLTVVRMLPVARRPRPSSRSASWPVSRVSSPRPLK